MAAPAFAVSPGAAPSLAPAQPRSAPLQRAAAAPAALDSNSRAAVPLACLAGAVSARALARRARRARRSQLQRSAKAHENDQTYYNFTGFPFPLGPLFQRRTVRTQVDDGIWTFEQEQSLANIAVNTRMTVIRLESGGLWVHNPVAPTEECDRLLRELGMPVEYIVLGCAQYEHKIFVGPFARRWPDAKVYTVPQQWSWPVDLPSAFYGIYSAGELKDGDESTPWAGEIEQRLLCPKDRLGFSYSAAECAFYHKRSKTLLCTDALVYVPEEPPAVLDKGELNNLGRLNGNIVVDAVALVDWRGSGDIVREAQREEAAATTVDEEEFTRIGWKRDALLALYFGPDGRSIVDPSKAFDAISGRWLVGPVCYSLVYSGKIKQEVSDWAEKLCEWDIQQILPAHFAGGQGTSDDVRRAFDVLRKPSLEDGTVSNEGALPWPFPQPVNYRAQDLQLLTDLKNILNKLNVI